MPIESVAIPPIIEEFKRGEINQHEPFSRAEIINGIDRVGATLLHTHLEGIFTPVDLEGMFTRLQIQLDPQIIEMMRQNMSPAEPQKNLMHFIHRLSTRWLRAGLMQGVMDGIDYRTILKEYFSTALEKLYAQGITNVELMSALLNMTYEGDLASVVIPPGSVDTAEGQLISKWNSFVKDQEVKGMAANVIPTIRTYLRTLKRTVKADSRFQWGNEQTDYEGRIMRVAPIIQIRRDQLNDRKLMDDPDRPYQEMRKEGLPIADEMINCYYGIHEDGPLFEGFNFAGIEDKADSELHKFSSFFQMAAYHGIPTNVHAGEISLLREYLQTLNPYIDINTMSNDEFLRLCISIQKKGLPENVKAGIKNLYFVAKSNHIKRIGHAVLLMRLPHILRTILEKNKHLELCKTSNDWTYVSTEERHDFVNAVAGNHSMFMHDPALHEMLVMQSTPYDDDAVIFDTPYSLAEEIHNLCKKTNNLGFTEVDDLLIFLKNSADTVAVWNHTRKKRRKIMFPHDDIAMSEYPAYNHETDAISDEEVQELIDNLRKDVEAP